MTMKRSN